MVGYRNGRRASRARAPLASAAVAVLGALLLAGCGAHDVERPVERASVAAPATWFVDCSSPANGSGSRGSPWNTTAAVAQHGAFRPGERILLKRGTICTGMLAPTGSGTSDAPIVIGAYGEGTRPVVSGQGTSDQTGTVHLVDVHDWVVQDLQVTNFDPAGPDDTLRAGILVADDGSGLLSGIIIRRNIVRRVTSSPTQSSTDPHKYGGIVVLVRGTGARTGALSDVRVEDNLVDHVGRIGIVVWSDAWPTTPLTGVSISGNRVVRAEGDSVIVWGVDGAVIEHNISEQGGRLPSCPRCTTSPLNTASAGIWPVMSTRILMRYNEVSGEGAAGGDGEGFDIDDSTSAVVMEGNYAHDNEGGGVLICGARDSDIRFNVFENDGGGEIVFSCPTQRDGVRIVNNTISLPVGSSGQVVRHNRTSGTDPVLFANNLVLDLNGGGYDWPAPVTAAGNLYAGTVPSSAPADATAATVPGLLAPGTGGVGIDSVQGYTPGPGSAAGSGAVPVPDMGTVDYFGRTPSGSPGRGAIAASSTPAPLLPAVPSAQRSDVGVVVSWTAARGSAWQLQRSVDQGTFRVVSGSLTAGRFVDAAPPAGALRYRLVQLGRDGAGVPSAPAEVAR